MVNVHTGDILWKKTGYVNTPAVTVNGTIVVMYRPNLFSSNTLVALDNSGNVMWSIKYDTGASSDIVCDPTTSNLFFTVGEYLWVLTSSGGLVWKYPLYSYSGMTPSIDSNGNIYVGASDGYLHSVFPSGKLRWYQTFDPFSNRDWSTIDNLHQSLYIRMNYDLLALRLSDGSTKFSIRLNDGYSKLPAIGKDGTIYMVQTSQFSFDVNVTSYDPISGGIQWTSNIPNHNFDTEGRGPPSISNDGVLYVLTDVLSAVDALHGDVLWSQGFMYAKDFTNAPTILPDGSLLTSSDYCWASRVNSWIMTLHLFSF